MIKVRYAMRDWKESWTPQDFEICNEETPYTLEVGDPGGDDYYLIASNQKLEYEQCEKLIEHGLAFVDDLIIEAENFDKLLEKVNDIASNYDEAGE